MLEHFEQIEKEVVNKIYKFVLLYPNKKYICRQMTLL